jgi:hypothetical protein
MVRIFGWLALLVRDLLAEYSCRGRSMAAEVTAQRQRTVLPAGGKELVMLIGEAALCWWVGGAQVMRGQLSRLARLRGRAAWPPSRSCWPHRPVPVRPSRAEPVMR